MSYKLPIVTPQEFMLCVSKNSHLTSMVKKVNKIFRKNIYIIYINIL